MALNIYTKLGKAIQQGDKKAKHQAVYEKGGLQLIKAIEAECNRDKTMSNLKGKIKEIQHLIEHL